MTNEQVAEFFITYQHKLPFVDMADKAVVVVEHPTSADIRRALQKLCALKLHKEVSGKDDYYKQEQPKAWAEAFKLLGLK